MDNAELRAIARAKLGGKWTGGKWLAFAIAALIYVVIIGVTSSVSSMGGMVSVLCSIITAVLAGVFEVSLSYMAIRVVRGEYIKTDDIWFGFKYLGKTIWLTLVNSVLLTLWSMLFVIPGIIKYFSYSMSYYVLADNPNLTAGEARERSIELMEGHKYELFCLLMSFLGWIVLSCLTLGILFIWIIPYMETAGAEFYHKIAYIECVEETVDTPVKEQA